MLITSCIGLFFNLINMFVLEYMFNPEKEPEAAKEITESEVEVQPTESADKE